MHISFMVHITRALHRVVVRVAILYRALGTTHPNPHLSLDKLTHLLTPVSAYHVHPVLVWTFVTLHHISVVLPLSDLVDRHTQGWRAI